MIGNALLVIVSFLLGWAALWPARRALGGWDYHLAALPVGLLGWTASAAAAALVGRPMGWTIAAPSLVAYAGIVFAVLRRAAGRSGRPAPAWWTFAVAGCIVALSASAAAAAGLTVPGYDGWKHYQVMGVWIVDHGLPTALMMGQRSPLIPSVIAGTRLLGGAWSYAIYPVMALNVVVVLLRAAWVSGVRRVGPRVGAGLLAALALALVTLPSFLLHSVYAHSQMYSALFLLLSVAPVVAIAACEREAAQTSGDDHDERPLALLTVAGLAAAGLALSRPDGLAYLFVPLLLLLVVRFERGWTLRRVLSYCVPLFATLAVSYAPAFARLRLWESTKLSGKAALAMLVAAAAVVVASEALARWKGAEWLRRGRNVMRLALTVDLVLVAAAAAAVPKTFAAAVGNMVGNLLFSGGYGRLWVFLLGALVVTLAFGALRRGLALADVLFVVAQFFAVALIVHGLTHPGRLSQNDSFNRVAFHIVPIALWYVTGAAAALWPRSQRTAESSPVAREAE